MNSAGWLPAASRRTFLSRLGAASCGSLFFGTACGRPAEEGGEIAPEFLLFGNAMNHIVEHCVYRVQEREVFAGALRGLARQLGPKFAPFFTRQTPVAAELGAVYIGTLREIAASPAAKSAGLSLKNLVERSIDGYCRSLDGYSEYADEATVRRMDEAVKPDYVGIGLTFRRTADGFFCAPFPGGAADRAGVLREDELVEIDGANARTMTLLEISARLGGVAGSRVKAKFKQLQSLDPGRALVLDFRGCPGGEFCAAIRIAELFLPEKTVVAKLETKRERVVETSTNRRPYRPRQLRLLQDDMTASGAELIIAALLSHPEIVRAESRGAKSFGKGVTTRPIKLERGGILKITDSRVYGPHDEFWDGEGLPPSSEAKPDAP